MEEAKYIVVDKLMTESPIVFPCWMSHKEIAGDMKVISAGMVSFGMDSFNGIAVHCYGKSTSCVDDAGNPIRSRGEEDALLIALITGMRFAAKANTTDSDEALIAEFSKQKMEDEQ